MTRVVHLFLDTNVLLQCRALEELDWSAWRDFDEVHLIISRPVQSEIDSHKNKGGDRVAQRARKASSRLRDIILGSNEYADIRPTDPAVKLFLRPELRPSPELAEVLDYSRFDDQLVGIVHAFTERNPGAEARVLTHDTGPMGTARMIGVAIAPVPNDWLLPPEPSEADKRIRSLEAEVARLKQMEPQFSVACIDADGEELSKLERELVYYEPLAAADLSTLIEKIKRRFPLATDFGPRERAERPVQGLFQLMARKQVFTPATDREIEDYQEKHARWLKQCEDRLRNIHRLLQTRDGPPVFVFSVRNDGARPANDALVTFRARGQFQIMPPADDDDDEYEYEDEAADTPEPRTLPHPPTAPCGRWADMFAAEIGALKVFQNVYSSLGGATDRPSRHESLLRLPRITPHDPNGFYYKPDRPSQPSEQFSLECQQWRHGIEPELFVGQIHFDETAETMSGLIECRIHAENLSQCVEKSVPIRIRVQHVGVLETAEKMVEQLCRQIV
jgi:hypothetical protein